MEEKGDEERSLLILKNKENVSLAESNENKDSHGCSLPGMFILEIVPIIMSIISYFFQETITFSCADWGNC